MIYLLNNYLIVLVEQNRMFQFDSKQYPTTTDGQHTQNSAPNTIITTVISNAIPIDIVRVLENRFLKLDR